MDPVSSPSPETPEPTSSRPGAETDGLATPDVGNPEGDLAGGLTALAGLASARLSLTDILTQVASSAVQAIPGAEGAGLTLVVADRADTVVSSTDFVRDVEDIQYGIGKGPCISAAQTGQTMRSGSLGGDRRWPRFGLRVGRPGVHSVLSLPLLVHDKVVGAMNVYARGKGVFGDRAERIGQRFAVPAAVAYRTRRSWPTPGAWRRTCRKR